MVNSQTAAFVCGVCILARVVKPHHLMLFLFCVMNVSLVETPCSFSGGAVHDTETSFIYWFYFCFEAVSLCSFSWPGTL